MSIYSCYQRTGRKYKNKIFSVLLPPLRKASSASWDVVGARLHAYIRKCNFTIIYGCINRPVAWLTDLACNDDDEC